MESNVTLFAVRCPYCGVESSGPIEKKKFATVPVSEYILLRSLCNVCKQDFIVACWILSPTTRHHDRGCDELDDSLLESYQTVVEEVLSCGETCVCDMGMFEIKGSVAADLGFLRETGFQTKPTIPMEALALARGMRMAAMEDSQQFFRCTIGPLDLSLGVVDSGRTSPKYSMHLNVFDRVTRGPLSDRQFNFAASLFFGSHEVDRSYEIPSDRGRDLIVPLPHPFVAASVESSLIRPSPCSR